MFVNIAHLTLVPPKRPDRPKKPKKRAPSTPSQGSESNNIVNGGSHLSSDQYLNDLVSQTESELSFMSSETAMIDPPEFHVHDRVAWPSDSGYEKAFIRWIGTLPEDISQDGEVLVGVEFVSTAHFLFLS